MATDYWLSIPFPSPTIGHATALGGRIGNRSANSRGKISEMLLTIHTEPMGKNSDCPLRSIVCAASEQVQPALTWRSCLRPPGMAVWYSIDVRRASSGTASGFPLPAQPVDVSQSYHKRPSLNDGCWQSRHPAARPRLPFLTRSGLDGRSPRAEPATSRAGLNRLRCVSLSIG